MNPLLLQDDGVSSPAAIALTRTGVDGCLFACPLPGKGQPRPSVTFSGLSKSLLLTNEPYGLEQRSSSIIDTFVSILTTITPGDNLYT
jgi:hypothetical protein